MHGLVWWFLLGCLFLGAVTPTPGQPKTDPAQPTAKDPSPEELITKEIGSLDIGNRQLRLWESTRNPNVPPEQWQFRFDPLFLPEMTADNKIAFTGPTPIGNSWEVSFNLLLNSPKVNALAIDRVKSLKPADAGKLNSGNVFARPILWLRMTPKGTFRDAFPTAQMSRPFWTMARPGSQIRIGLQADSRQEAEDIIAHPERLDMDIEYALVAATTVVTKARVTSRQLNNSELVVRLDGLGKPEVYIRRFDARRLLDDLRAIVIGDVLLENRDAFTDSILQRFLNKHFERVQATEQSFNAEKWKATFHGDDLKPDVLTKALQKVYKYDETTKKWAARKSVDTSAKASLLGILGGEAAFKASYAEDDFKKFLSQRNIEVDLTGNIIVVKSIDLFRVNLANLKSDFDTQISWTEVRPPQVSKFDESLNIGGIAKEAVVALAQTRAALTRREMETSQTAASTERTAYGATQWISDEGKRIAGEAARDLQAAEASARAASEELARDNYTVAAEKYQDARRKFEAAQSKYADAKTRIEPERFVSLYAFVKTGRDNKECGGWRVRVLQGGNQIFQDEWGWGTNWDNGSENPPPPDRTKALSGLVTGGKLEVFSSIEERPGEIRIDWHIDTMTITLKTNRGREFPFERENFWHKSRGEGGSKKTRDIPAK